MSQAGPLIRYAADDAVATLTLDSPHNRNALSEHLVSELLAALDQAASDDAVRVVILTHTGGTFCAGADLSEASGGAEGDPVVRRGQQLTAVLRAIVAHPKPVLARLDGHVRAGGMGLIGACDLVVAGPSSTFALTEVRLGLAPSVISSVVLPRLADRRASRLFLTGETIDAATAEAIGLITLAAPDAGQATSHLVADLLKGSPQGLAETKALVNHHLLAQLDADSERLIEQSARLFASPAARDAMQAFLSRRR